MGILLLLTLLLLYWFWLRPRLKAGRAGRAVQQGEIVQIETLHQVDRNLPLGNLAVVYKIDSRGIYVVLPKLTARGAVSYVDRRYDARSVQLPKPKAKQQEQYRKLQLIAPLMADQFQLEPKLTSFKKHAEEIAELRRLAASSVAQADQVRQLNQELNEISQWLVEVQQFQQASLNCIRELLIANELEEQEFDSLEVLNHLSQQASSLLQTADRLHDAAESHRHPLA